MTRELFSIRTYCTVNEIDPAFINSLNDEGLIHITRKDEDEFIDEDQLQELEIYTRWHYEMGINPEGIDAIKNLIERLRIIQRELHILRSRLKLYEDRD